MELNNTLAVEPLAGPELEGLAGGSEFGRIAGWVVGYAIGLIVNADPFDGNYYGVGA